MRYLLDTDHISALQRRSGSDFKNLAARISQLPAADFGLSIISFHEQILGAHNFINRARTRVDVIRGYTLLLETLQGFSAAPVLQLDAEAIAIFNELREQRVRVSTMDLRIASIALSRNLVLLTRNISDFEKVPGLALENWTV
ncbi:MAG: type II toxin-antitoxin system VapC family toxin [Drouetiella hepatica Uher 2000/2452]|uniref:Type II toxin-antitoxin system VapC family toxin n=1 Tax=Drouetiella hepatica Uher 2000/2452 TaxID=904376 RepID=A0A951Q940_9CYAN|nr:type II toxin-antitoxin system VapC family toxin [Drouetiella hepatica Uher 2000/2452]